MPQPTTYAMFFGPDRTPFLLGPRATVHCPVAVPFHGIVSRGLLPLLTARADGVDLWHRYAHRLFDESVQGDDCDLKALSDAARERDVLSFGQSALAARTYLEHYCQTQPGGVLSCELWNIKEGHTSSVWHVTVDQADGHYSDFILNVARDRDAGEELDIAARKMQRIGEVAPDVNMVGVSDIAAVRIDYFGQPVDVRVIRNEFVADGYEIHSATDRATGSNVLVLVERFLTADDCPAKISSILGRRLPPGDCRQIADDIDAFLRAAARHEIEASVDINDGDVVWNGRRATVVAIR